MRQQTSKRAGGRRGSRALAIAMLAGAAGWLLAGPARANNDFQNGFEDQLGRIVAHQAAALGARVIYGAGYPVVAPRPVYAPIVYAPAYAPRPPGYGYVVHKQKLKLRQVAYYPARPCHAGCDRGARGHGRSGCGHASHGRRYGHDRD